MERNTNGNATQQGLLGAIIEMKPEWRNVPDEGLFVIVEDNGDRCLVSPLHSDLAIVPVELVASDMFVIIHTQPAQS